MKKEIEKIIKKHIGSVNSFVDDNGHNHFNDTVNDLDIMFKNELWIIGSDIMKKSGVKTIKTNYKNKYDTTK